MRYGILLDDGKVIEDPIWDSPAAVISSFHGFGTNRVYGTLVRCEENSGIWQPC